VDLCLPSLLRALKGFSSEIILVADRCTDKTVERAGKYNVKILEKTWKKWSNSYSESLQLGYSKAAGTRVSIVDVDIVVPANFFEKLLPKLKGKIVSVAAGVATYPDTFWNKVMNAWEKTYQIAPLGKEPYGAARLIIKDALDEVSGFQDVPTPDTDLDLRLTARGYRSVGLSTLTVHHIRHVSPKTVMSGQIVNGRGRFALGVSFVRTLGHAVFRLRPFLIGGWLFEWQRTIQTAKSHGTT